MDEENCEDLDCIELYLRTLRKKVQHQLKNPFGINVQNYTFEELTNWKNNVLQLDATSRLYGQRVDFLHVGTMQILGSVINIQQEKEQKKVNAQVVSARKVVEEGNPILKNLQTP